MSSEISCLICGTTERRIRIIAGIGPMCDNCIIKTNFILPEAVQTKKSPEDDENMDDIKIQFYEFIHRVKKLEAEVELIHKEILTIKGDIIHVNDTLRRNGSVYEHETPVDLPSSDETGDELLGVEGYEEDTELLPTPERPGESEADSVEDGGAGRIHDMGGGTEDSWNSI